MGFQNENQLKVGALVKATINDKVVEAKVIGIGFNRITLRSEKGNEVSYAFNSEKFLKWFNHTPLSEVAKNHAESGNKDILEGLKVVTSGPTIKEMTTTPKEKEDRFKLAFGFRGVEEEGVSVSEVMISDYTLTERKSRLGVLLSPMLYSGNGSQISA
ncbi:hP0423 family protein, partial [Helicobacter pylori]